jgi:hypothetical protein
MSELKAIETSYKGYRFRSRLEARWAVFFDAASIAWQYEAQGFETSHGRYLPDFYLPILKRWVEVKREGMLPKPENIYIAGKMSLCRDEVSLNGHYYAGPNLRIGHDSVDGEEIVQSCLEGINECTCLLAFVNEMDVHGTLVEAGYALGRRKKVYVAFGREIRSVSGFYGDSGHGEESDLTFPIWFLRDLTDNYYCCDSLQHAIDSLFPLTDEMKKCASIAVDGNGAVLISGSPGDDRTEVAAFAKGKCVASWKMAPAIFHLPQTRYLDAVAAARSARFEFGESGA